MLDKIFGGFSDIAIGMFGFIVLTEGIEWIAHENYIADVIIRWGMVIIVGYGVLKIIVGNILWQLLFGYKAKINIGILDKLYRFLRPIRVQKIIETTDKEDNDEKMLEYVDRIEIARMHFEQKTWRCSSVKFKEFLATLNANKWTIIGTASVGGVALLSGLGVMPPLSPESMEALGDGNLVAIANTTGYIGAALLGLKAMLGAGIESSTEYTARVSAAKAAKTAKAAKKAKTSEQLLETKANLLSKKLGIEPAQAKEILIKKAEKDAKIKLAATEAKKKALAEKKAKKEDLIVEKLAKNLGISKEEAAPIRAAQLAHKSKKPATPKK
jgi:hypothetical protein